MTDDTAGGIRRGAALMASGTATSRVLGFVRVMVLAAAIGGTTQVADAFAVANQLPNILYMLLIGGVLNAILVPQVVRAYKRNAGQEYVDRLLTIGFLSLAAITLLLTLAAPILVGLYANFDNHAQTQLAITFAFWCIPQMFFYGAYGLLGQVLNARGSFGPYMWAPVVNNVVSIAGFALFVVLFRGVKHNGVLEATSMTTAETTILGLSATLGVVAQAAVLLPALRRAGVRYRPRWGLRGSGLGVAGRVATWTLAGLSIGQLGYLASSNVSTSAPNAAVALGAPKGSVAGLAAYTMAFLIFMLPHSLVTVSLATAMFTRLSGHAHDNDTAGVRSNISYSLRTVGVFTVFATVAIAVLALPLTRVLLFTAAAQSAHAVAPVTFAMVLGLPAFGVWSIYQRVFYAYEDARSMLPVQIVMAAVVVSGAFASKAVLSPTHWVVGIGVSMSVSYVVGMVYAQILLRRRVGSLDGPRVLRVHARAGLAALVSAAVGMPVLFVLAQVLPDRFVGAVTECAVVGTLMALVYVGALRVLRVRELDGLLQPVLRRLPGRRR
ncbi:murein biosynthesis integral membrane protein MurJ [Cellulomonas sp. URHD0024]|uniref:murein biosynthesis integral membrane protein MurJ n=1 Tax=Cellulomonas sp. URHD0024 TaxID=1302620 RepID=UPI0004279368|nr:murein biosynthesis integral membrane protein MurJ [Cellulomonas sp. URHD0024]